MINAEVRITALGKKKFFVNFDNLIKCIYININKKIKGFLIEIWFIYPQKIEDSEVKVNNLLNILKKGTREKS